MPYASNTTVASGTTPNVAVPFNYIQQADVNVSLNGVVVAQSTLVWTSASTIQLPSTPASGTVVKVYRTTNASNLDTTFQDPSVLEGSDLNTALLQMLYVSQEAFDAAAVTATELTTITDYVNTAMAAAAESATAAANSAAAAAGIAAGNAFISEGNWDASAGTFPGAGTAPKNGLWRVSVAGVVGGITFNVGDGIYALATNASTTTYAANWQRMLGSLSTAEVITTLGGSPWSTGDVKLTMKTVADSGWLMWADQTIGNVGSGAAYAAVAAQALYILAWTNYSNSVAPVTGGRGASATADWAALKPLQLTPAMGRAIGVAGSGSGLTARALGSSVGEETHTLAETEMPAHTHGGATGNDSPDHTHSTFATGGTIGASGGGLTASQWGAGTSGGASARHAHSIASDGGGLAHNNMQPTSFSWNSMVKL